VRPFRPPMSGRPALGIGVPSGPPIPPDVVPLEGEEPTDSGTGPVLPHLDHDPETDPGFEGWGDFGSADPYQRWLAHQAAKGNL
jgi:hypothetical protein